MVASAPIHDFLEFFNQYPAKYSFQATGCFSTEPLSKQQQQWDRNESCRNDYYQSSERILAEPGIEPATVCS